MKLGRGHPVRRTPDLTPMVDVIFLLIVFFLAAARLEQDRREPVDLPQQAGEAEQKRREGLVLTLLADGTPEQLRARAPQHNAVLVSVAADKARAVEAAAQEIDGVAAVEQHALLAIDERDRTHARRRRRGVGIGRKEEMDEHCIGVRQMPRAE